MRSNTKNTAVLYSCKDRIQSKEQIKEHFSKNEPGWVSLSTAQYSL